MRIIGYSSEVMQLLKEQSGRLNGGINGGINGGLKSGIKDITSNGTVEDKVIKCFKNDNGLRLSS